MCRFTEDKPFTGPSPICYKVALKIDNVYHSVATPIIYESEKPITPTHSMIGRKAEYFKSSILDSGSHHYNKYMTGKTAAFEEIEDAQQLVSSIKRYYTDELGYELEGCTVINDLIILKVQFLGTYYEGRYQYEDHVRIGSVMRIIEEY